MRTAQVDARLVLSQAPTLESRRGPAISTLLHLMERDQSIQVLATG